MRGNRVPPEEQYSERSNAVQAVRIASLGLTGEIISFIAGKEQ